jgi:hypothetical protein
LLRGASGPSGGDDERLLRAADHAPAGEPDGQPDESGQGRHWWHRLLSTVKGR